MTISDRGKRIGAAVAIALSCIGMYLYVSYPLTNQEQQHRQSETKQTQAEEHRIRPFSAADVKALVHQEQSRSEQDNSARQTAIAESNVRVSMALWFVGVVTAILLYWYSLLTKQTAEAAEKGANAATKSADTAEFALHRAERAYFALEEVGVGKGGRFLHPRFLVRNTGRTPALNVQTRAWVHRGPDLPETADFRGTAYNRRAIIPCGGVIDHHLQWDMANLSNGDHVYCEAEYTDIFGKLHLFRCLASFSDGPNGPLIPCGEPVGYGGAYDYAD